MWGRMPIVLSASVLIASSGCRAGLPVSEQVTVKSAVPTADSIVRAAIGKLTPGAVLLVSKDGKVVHEAAYGFAQLNDFDGKPLAKPIPMRVSTVFDAASVTKVMATTFAAMLLVDRGQLDIDAPVHKYLGDFRGPRLDSITVRHLLNHSSGLVQWQPLYYQASSSRETYEAIRKMPLGWGVGAGRHYSDLGFMLLGYVIEAISGKRLDAFLDDELYRPLGLKNIAFNPRKRGFTEFAATESGNAYERQMVYDPNFGYDYAGDPKSWDGWRQYVTVGETNDGNAWYANEGVAGHAGLFATARDLGVLIDILNAGGTGERGVIVREETVDKFLTRDRYGHYLGWQVPAEMPEGTFAHTGFTGTWVAGVPKHDISIILLTNRQNMGRDAKGFFPDVGPLRTAVGKAVISDLVGND
jgi:CubicO group peptidase (beta-lactamase class C family)